MTHILKVKTADFVYWFCTLIWILYLKYNNKGYLECALLERGDKVAPWQSPSTGLIQKGINRKMPSLSLGITCNGIKKKIKSRMFFIRPRFHEIFFDGSSLEIKKKKILN